MEDHGSSSRAASGLAAASAATGAGIACALSKARISSTRRSSPEAQQV